jgi:hypothetical protein
MMEGLEQRSLLEGSFATAIVVALDGNGLGTSAGAITPATSSTDNDYYQFVAPATDFVSILSDTANEAPISALDTRVTVYAADQTTIVAQGVNNGRLTRGIAKDGWAGFVAEAGQTYFVVPRIKDLTDIEQFLRTQVPEVKYVVGHGQMAPTQLEEVMTAFYEGQYDVLLATTIVESGLDIPSANTLVVHPLACAHAPEIGPQRNIAQGVKGACQRGHHLVVLGPAL